MTTIYVGDADTRRVTVTKNGRASPLGSGPYLWGRNGEGTTNLARDLAAHASEGHTFDADPDTITGFAAELAQYRADRPFTLSGDSVREALAKYRGEGA